MVLSLIASVPVYAQYRSYQAVGRFLTLKMFLTALSWGWQEPSAYLNYVNPKLLVGIVLSVMLVGGAGWRLARHMRKQSLPTGAGNFLRAASLTGFLGAGFMLLLSWVPAIPATTFHRSVLVSAIEAFWEDAEVDTREFAGLQVPDLLKLYRERVHAPAPYKDAQYWGKAKGSNVLIVVLETLPARYLSLNGPIDDFPNLRRLRERSFVAVNHLTTYPYTSRAMFSMLSSWYPSDQMKGDLEQHPDLVIPSTMRILSGLGYDTATFGASPWQGGMDIQMFYALGVQRLLFPRPQYPAFKHRNETRTPGWEARRLELDEDVLQQLEDDLAWQSERRHPFAHVFLPQISHFPLPNFDSGQSNEDLTAQERTILVREDAWLGRILQVLEKHHQLDNTIIVVTGDHGVRTRQEDPSLPAGMIDEYSFHVPLLIYAPQALQHTVTIPWVTSHIDVSPTLLDLLGVNHMRDFELGTPIWSPELAKRTTYLFAYAQFGADGYYSDGKFFMWNRIFDSVYENSAPHFGPQNLVLKGSPSNFEVTRSISQMVGLQQVWETHFCSADSVRNHLYNRSKLRTGAAGLRNQR